VILIGSPQDDNFAFILNCGDATGGEKSRAGKSACAARSYLSEVAVFTLRPGATMGCRNGIMARRPGPSCSMECCCSALRLARKLGQPLSFSSIHFWFGGIADGVTHVAEAAAIDQIDDKFQFVETFEVGDLGLVACFGERFESRFD
jgi:hypothetical protein